MYCWNCGKEIDNQMTFCPYCGIKQAGGSKPPKENHKSILAPVICAAICVTSLLSMVRLLTGNKEAPEPQVQVPISSVSPVETQAPTATEALAEVKVTEAVKTESTVDPNSRELPDLASFLDTKYTQDEWGYTHYVTCLVDKDDEDAMLKAVLDLLQEPQYLLELMDKDDTMENGKQCTNFTFEYTGKNSDVDWVYLKAGGKYHVKLTKMAYSKSQTAFILYTHPEFYLEDPGRSWNEEAVSSGTAQKTTSVSSGGTVLPSFLEFAEGSGFKVTNYSEDSDEYTLQYYVADPRQLGVVQDYIDLLIDDIGCNVQDKEIKDWDDWYSESWLLKHPAKAVPSSAMDPYLDGKGNVRIGVNLGYDMDACYFTMECMKGLEHPDAKGMETDDSNGKVICVVCHQEKGPIRNCPSCGGNNWINCNTCTNGRCPGCSA